MGALAIYESPTVPGGLLLRRPGPEVPTSLVGDLNCHEPEHLCTWLEVQLRAAGRASPQDGAYLCSYAEVEALARDFIICSADRSLRQTTAEEALRIREALGGTAQEATLKRQLLKLGSDWGSLDASRELLADHVEGGRFAEARKLLDAADFPETERLLSMAEVAMAEGQKEEANARLQHFLDRLDAQPSHTEAELLQVLDVLRVCLSQPELLSVAARPFVASQRQALLGLVDSGEDPMLSALLRPNWQAFLVRHRVTLGVLAAVLAAMYLARATIVPVLLFMMWPMGVLGLGWSYLKRKRK